MTLCLHFSNSVRYKSIFGSFNFPLHAMSDLVLKNLARLITFHLELGKIERNIKLLTKVN